MVFNSLVFLLLAVAASVTVSSRRVNGIVYRAPATNLLAASIAKLSIFVCKRSYIVANPNLRSFLVLGLTLLCYFQEFQSDVVWCFQQP